MPDSRGDSAAAVLDGRPGSAVNTVIARQEIEYLAPIPYMRRPVDVELWIGRLGGASLEVCYEVYSPKGVEPRVLFTKAATTLVMVDCGHRSPHPDPTRLSEQPGHRTSRSR